MDESTRGRLQAVSDGCLALAGLVPRVSVPSIVPNPECAATVNVLPAFPGEFGVEIRYFLGRVEPWLNAGWRILARRPELYPAGAVIAADDLWPLEAELFRAYGAPR